MRRKNRPEQLRLQLEWNYLDRLESDSERLDVYEQSAVSLYRTYTFSSPGPVIEEIVQRMTK